MFKLLQILTKLKLFISRAKLIGVDEYRNKYYELKQADYLGRKKRICIYFGTVEASKIPSNWHNWMHHSSTEEIKYKRQFWMKSHIPNVTGTNYAFQPNRHTQSNIHGKSFIDSNASYQAWDGKISEE